MVAMQGVEGGWVKRRSAPSGFQGVFRPRRVISRSGKKKN